MGAPASMHSWPRLKQLSAADESLLGVAVGVASQARRVLQVFVRAQALRCGLHAPLAVSIRCTVVGSEKFGVKHGGKRATLAADLAGKPVIMVGGAGRLRRAVRCAGTGWREPVAPFLKTCTRTRTLKLRA